MIHTHSFFPASPDRILDYVTSPASEPSSGDNFTLLPDNLLLRPGTVPVITIRDPRLVVPSAYRAMRAVIKGGGRANMLVITCHVWGRFLYDFYANRRIRALVIDADDYMTSETFVREICSQTGLDPDAATFSWPTATPEQQDKLAKPFAAVQTTLMRSNGANPGRAAKNVDLGAAEAKWEEEFGADTAREIGELVQLAMPHFEYLYERRLQC
ncbi:hypothetical protein N7492_005365 [Penicillium capsulatum]|uniref:Uncharacterized protein n=1 Tax=Penicillium capsulatum TaxID=69766 RepID=A0A9W9IFM4_9EURO|nr:hypothetical protein N7492_005365 [Penicillium capsulatum]KAJ6135535.1 hypothetical protein N7512_000695 [Penicillium capsulatum]